MQISKNCRKSRLKTKKKLQQALPSHKRTRDHRKASTQLDRRNAKYFLGLEKRDQDTLLLWVKDPS